MPGPLKGKSKRRTASERFSEMLPEIMIPGECWLWRGSLNTINSYGRFTLNGRSNNRPDKIVYEKTYGPIPTGMTLIHTCPHKHCVNPDHVVLGPISREALFWANVPERPAVGCWLWAGRINGDGYGMFGGAGRGRTVMAHRISYEWEYGPIEPKMVIDHVAARGCQHHNCVRPDHLEAVTHKVNILRGNGACAEHARKTHCKNGHLLEGDNIQGNGRFRRCKECRRTANIQPKATHCPHGHPYAGDNLYVNPKTGFNFCRQCNRERRRKLKVEREIKATHFEITPRALFNVSSTPRQTFVITPEG